MPIVNAIIADDERELRVYLRKRLKESWPGLTICGEAEDGNRALALIREVRPEIAFLDIRMPGLSGLEVAQQAAGCCHIVFITAYDQYAVEAFDNEAVDYLLKPVTRKRLEKTVQRLKQRLSRQNLPATDMDRLISRLVGLQQSREEKKCLQWIQAQRGDSIRLIPVDDISFFKAEDKYTRVVTRSGETLIRKPIKELAESLDPEKFWRIHRSTIVNAGSIDRVSRSLTGRYVIKLKNSSEILTVSRTYAHRFKQM